MVIVTGNRGDHAGVHGIDSAAAGGQAGVRPHLRGSPPRGGGRGHSHRV